MAIRNIRTVGDDLLRKRSREIEVIDDKIKTLVMDMAETMDQAKGVGLAAPQIGILKRLILVRESEDLITVAINPEILDKEGEVIDEEGCLSVPDQFGDVKRPQKIKIKYIDLQGNTIERTVEDYTARIFCHEIDHLEGILYIDKVEDK